MTAGTRARLSRALARARARRQDALQRGDRNAARIIMADIARYRRIIAEG